MSIRKELHGIDQGEPTKIKASTGTVVSSGKASFKDGISQLPALKGSDSYPSRGRINFGKDKLTKVP